MNIETELIDYVTSKFIEEINSWDDEIVKSIYALSLYLEDLQDYETGYAIILEYNTIENYNDSVDSASSESEAKWNYSFWLQNSNCSVGNIEIDKDKKGIELVRKWVKTNLVQNGFEDNSEADEYFEDNIKEDFCELALKVISKIKKSEKYMRRFNEFIPILIFDLEYEDVFINASLNANSELDLSDVFSWIE